jgi:hypothetical protein
MALDDPEEMPGIERDVCVAAFIKCFYSRCDRAERQKQDKVTDPGKVEAESAIIKVERSKPASLWPTP